MLARLPTDKTVSEAAAALQTAVQASHIAGDVQHASHETGGGLMHTTLNSIKLSTADAGHGLPLVFLHGFPLSRGAWQKQIDAFRSSYRVIAPDLRGFGDSDTQPGPTSMAQYATDVHALLAQLTTGPVVLIGHSMGGYVALAFARQFPDMLRGLVLVSTKAGQDTAEGAAGRRATAEKVRAEGVRVVVEAMAPKMIAAGNQDARMAEHVRGFMASSTPAGVIGALLGMAERPDATALLAQIVVPTMVITGADDTLIPPAESEQLAQAIRGAQLNVIPHAGHLVAFEQPDEFNRVLKEWLNRTDLASLDPR
jgi:3-oxoadipate enol-lactonase